MARLAGILGYGNVSEAPAGSIPWAATVVPDAAVAKTFTLSIPTTSGVAIAAAANPGGDLTFIVVNASGAASMTPPAFDTSYHLASNNVFPPPAVVGKTRCISFAYNGSVYIETSRTLSDI